MSTSRNTPLSASEGVAMAAVISLVGGLLLPKAGAASLDRAVLVWTALSISCGIVLGSIVEKKSTLLICTVPSLVFMLSITGFYSARWLANKILYGERAERIAIGMGSGMPIYIDGGIQLILMIIFFVLISIATFIAMVICTLASRPLLLALKQVYKFGPEGFGRLKKIIAAIISVIALIIILWGSFGT